MKSLEIRIPLDGEGLVNKEELELRWQLADLIEERNIGHVTGSGSGFGQMDISVDVADESTGKSKLRSLANELGISEVTIRTV